MSATRLLVLGAVRVLQPVHGYDVRRELVSWRLEESAHIKPGSIYSALKTLAKDGLLAATAGDAEKPERTSYVLTGEGEKEFQTLLRAAWWRVVQPAEPLVPALTLMPFLPREELLAALQSRVTQLQAALEEGRFVRATIQDGATGAEGGVPEHVREIVDFVAARTRAELTWTKELVRRLRDGAYQFAGEADWLDLGPGRGLAATNQV
jgi:DNA-binding PadR family transcriptional regulator